MTNMCNLPRDLVEEIISRVPVKSLRAVRLTCKTWNIFSKDMSFVKKFVGQAKVAVAKKNEFMVIMMMDFRVYLMHVNLHKLCIKREAKLISLNDPYLIDIYKVFHSDGLLLSITKDGTLVVWNPYSGHSRRIEFEPSIGRWDMDLYALGYAKSNKSCHIHKILRFNGFVLHYKIYDFNSDSWRILDISPNKMIHIPYYRRGVSLKGNTYWFVESNQGLDTFLVCFDFTRERFGPPLSLSFEFRGPIDSVTLSSVREEQLAILFLRCDTLMMEIWITTRIEPSVVSWNSKVFLAVNIDFPFEAMSFFIDEEKKVAVVLDKNKEVSLTRNVAYIVGVDGTLKVVDLGVSFKKCYPLVCTFVPC